jgi:hypothetical protein
VIGPRNDSDFHDRAARAAVKLTRSTARASPICQFGKTRFMAAQPRFDAEGFAAE